MKTTFLTTATIVATLAASTVVAQDIKPVRKVQATTSTQGEGVVLGGLGGVTTATAVTIGVASAIVLNEVLDNGTTTPATTGN